MEAKLGTIPIKNVQEFHTMWNRCLRRLLDVPFRTHVRYLPHSANMAHSISQVYARFAKITNSMLNSTNVFVRYLARYGIHNCQAIIGKNMKRISEMTQKNTEEILTNRNARKLVIYSCTPCDMITVRTIQELRRSNITQWYDEEKKDFITFLCIS